LEENSLTRMQEILSRKTSVIGAAHGEDFVILAYTVLIGLQSVTDGQTDGQTPMIWLRRAKHSATVVKKVGRSSSTQCYCVQL